MQLLSIINFAKKQKLSVNSEGYNLQLIFSNAGYENNKYTENEMHRLTLDKRDFYNIFYSIRKEMFKRQKHTVYSIVKDKETKGKYVIVFYVKSEERQGKNGTYTINEFALCLEPIEGDINYRELNTKYGHDYTPGMDTIQYHFQNNSLMGFTKTVDADIELLSTVATSAAAGYNIPVAKETDAKMEAEKESGSYGKPSFKKSNDSYDDDFDDVF